MATAASKDQSWREVCTSMFKAAVNAVDPHKAVLANLVLDGNLLKTTSGKSYDLAKYEKILVLGGGKGAYTMASAIEELLGQRITNGLVVTKTDHGGELKHITVLEGTHPLPSEENFNHTLKLIKCAQMADENTLVIFLMSGGASALLPAPVEGISLQEKFEVTKALLSCGADIKEINCIRKHLSRLKGGRLLKLLGKATTISVVLSDVIGDNLHSIGSGPLTSDPSTFQEALSICAKYDIANKIPPTVLNYLKDGAQGKHEETLSEDAPVLNQVHHLMVGTNSIAVQAAAKEAQRLGFTTEILSTTLEGEAKELASFFAALGRHRKTSDHKKPHIILGGGETTVTLRGNGKGGRNQEFALAMVPLTSTVKDSFSASFATDGTDGPTDAAGAWCDNKTLETARQLDLSPQDYLLNNDAYHFFKETGDLIITGPTGTNVCDIYLFGLLK